MLKEDKKDKKKDRKVPPIRKTDLVY